MVFQGHPTTPDLSSGSQGLWSDAPDGAWLWCGSHWGGDSWETWRGGVVNQAFEGLRMRQFYHSINQFCGTVFFWGEQSKLYFWVKPIERGWGAAHLLQQHVPDLFFPGSCHFCQALVDEFQTPQADWMWEVCHLRILGLRSCSNKVSSEEGWWENFLLQVIQGVTESLFLQWWDLSPWFIASIVAAKELI